MSFLFLLGLRISTVPENMHNTQKNSEVPKHWNLRNVLWHTAAEYGPQEGYVNKTEVS